jgi:hypothetical protein
MLAAVVPRVTDAWMYVLAVTALCTYTNIYTMHEDLVDLRRSCAQGPMTFLSARSGPAWQRRRWGTWILSARSGPAWQRNGSEWTSMAEKGRRGHGRADAHALLLISSRI